MIRIGKPYITQTATHARLTADILIDDVKSSLWFEVENEYAKYLCDERSDAFVLGVFQFAMRYRHDIIAEAPMTKRLYEQFVDQFLLPFFRVSGFGRDGSGLGHAVQISCNLAPEVERLYDGAVGTGVSLGVDSMHVFATRKNITHGCIWNGHGEDGNATLALRDATWQALVSQARRFTDTVGVKLIVGNTNYDKGCHPAIKWEGMTTYGNLFCIYAMQKFWSVYYIASDCALENFQAKIDLGHSPEWYEYFMFPHVSTAFLSVRADGANTSRMDKVKALVNYPPATKFLNTCWRISENHRNCSYRCGKCMRTMISLDCYGVLDRFSDVYDVSYYHEHQDQYLAEYWRGIIKNDHFMVEMKPWMMRKHFSLGTRLSAARIVAKKMLGKVFRLGKIKQGDFSPT